MHDQTEARKRLTCKYLQFESDCWRRTQNAVTGVHHSVWSARNAMSSRVLPPNRRWVPHPSENIRSIFSIAASGKAAVARWPLSYSSNSALVFSRRTTFPRCRKRRVTAHLSRLVLRKGGVAVSAAPSGPSPDPPPPIRAAVPPARG